jgi:hypothetical protein
LNRKRAAREEVEGRPVTDRRANANKQVTLLVASLSSLLTSSNIAAINAALPSIGRDLSMAAVLLGWIPTSYLLACAMSLVPFGNVADLVGRKRVFMFWGGAGLVLVAQLVVMATFSPPAGRLSDRIEPRVVASEGRDHARAPSTVADQQASDSGCLRRSVPGECLHVSCPQQSPVT